jgi:Tol biopolymer transport system component
MLFLPMSGDPVRQEEKAPAGASPERLDSWKEIAAYFKRDVRTVRRWESLGLPVHRHLHKERSAVYAYTRELDQWWQNGKPRPPADAASVAPEERFGAHRVWLWGAGGVVLLLLAWTLAGRMGRVSEAPVPTPPVVTSLLSLVNSVSHLAFSADGRHLAFTWSGDKELNADIYVLRAGAIAPTRLTTHRGEECCPAWSGDGSRVAFIRMAGAETGIYVAQADGAERRLASLREGRYFDLAWTPDGRYVLFAEQGTATVTSQIFRLDLQTGTRMPLTAPPPQAGGDNRFSLSADGKTVAFVRHAHTGSRLFTIPLMGGEPQQVLEDGAWIGHVAWSSDHARLLFSSDRSGGSRLWSVALKGGRAEEIFLAGENTWFPATGAGRRLAFVRERQTINLNLWRLATNGGRAVYGSRLNPSLQSDTDPQFSPDGQKIVFASDRSGSSEIWTSRADASGLTQLTHERKASSGGLAWSPDGTRVAFARMGRIFLLAVTGGGLRDTGEWGGHPTWSRDGEWIYFFTTRTGQGEIWKLPAGGGAAMPVIRGGVLVARESFDGRSLYFSKLREKGVWRVPIGGGAAVRVVDSLAPEMAGYWAVAREGIYWMRLNSRKTWELVFYNEGTKRESVVPGVQGQPAAWAWGMALGPDGRSLVLADMLVRGADVMLVENFR